VSAFVALYNKAFRMNLRT